MKKPGLLIINFLGIMVFIMLLTNCAGSKINLHLYFYKQEIKDSLPELISAFTARYPEISFETEMNPDDSITILKTRLIAGNSPDIIQLQSYNQVSEFASLGYLVDLSNEAIISNVSSEALGAASYNGRIYALPMDFTGIGIIYNKDIFDKLNLEPPLTLSELKKTCSILKRERLIPFAGMLKVNWSSGHFITLLHASLITSKNGIIDWVNEMNSGNASWASPVNTNFLFDIMDFYKQNLDPRAPEMKLEEQQKTFAKGEAAMIVQGLWVYKDLLKLNPGLNCGFIPFPVSDHLNDQKFYADVDSTFAVSQKIDNRKKMAALKFINWLSSPEAVKIWMEKCQLLSTFKNVDSSNMAKVFQDLIEHTNLKGYYPWEFCLYPLSVYEIAVKNGAQAYFFGQKSREDVIRDINNAWKENRL